MFKASNNRKKQQRKAEFQNWFDELDEDSQQETCITYLRKLDNSSLKRLYAAVELYRKGDNELRKVKDPMEEDVAEEVFEELNNK